MLKFQNRSLVPTLCIAVASSVVASLVVAPAGLAQVEPAPPLRQPTSQVPFIPGVSNGMPTSIGGAIKGVINDVLRPATARGGLRNGLPPCTMDSFVTEAQEQAWFIYGDEGVYDKPPFMDGFTREHRIQRGIFDTRDAGLTTGHGSLLPDAWGGDEWTGNEWDRSNPATANVQPGGINIPIGPGNINIGPGGVNVGMGNSNVGIGQNGINGNVNLGAASFSNNSGF